jgi:hypothetical protein
LPRSNEGITEDKQNPCKTVDEGYNLNVLIKPTGIAGKIKLKEIAMVSTAA